jgi:hypothetical protein
VGAACSDLLTVAAFSGQGLRLRVGVAFTGSKAGAHPKAAREKDHKHRDKAQQRRQRKLAQRRDTTPVCDVSCLGHGAHHRSGRKV